MVEVEEYASSNQRVPKPWRLFLSTAFRDGHAFPGQKGTRARDPASASRDVVLQQVLSPAQAAWPRQLASPCMHGHGAPHA